MSPLSPRRPWVGLLTLALATPAAAQLPPNPDLPDLPDPTQDTLTPPTPLPESRPEPDAPFQFPDTVPLPTSPEAPAVEFSVETIDVVGNTRFETEIDALVQPLLEAETITLQDLFNLRTAITELYVRGGYVSSGAFVPNNQDLTDGSVTIQVVEGSVEEIQILGLDRLREGYVRSRIAPATATPLNLNTLEAALQLLQVDPLLSQVNAELTAGSAPGTNLLILELAEADPFLMDFGIDNYRSPSVGSLEGTVGATHLNLFGWGDRFSVGYSGSEGLDIVELRYTVPVNGLNGTVQVAYESESSRIIDPVFLEAGIRGNSDTFSLSYRQPLTRTLANEFALGLGFDWRESRSFILDDIPFSFSVGPEDGIATVSRVNFFQDWVNRDINSVIAARSQFNLGLGILGATVNDTGTDGEFFSWLGQFQWVEQLSSDLLLVSRVNAQLTPDSLLTLERFSIGGIDTVRGYIQDQIVTDNGITASTELRIAVAEDVQLTPFIDAGGGWNNQTPDPENPFLLGIGLGMQWQPNEDFSLRVDYGLPIIAVGDTGNSWQSSGIYFSIGLRPF